MEGSESKKHNGVFLSNEVGLSPSSRGASEERVRSTEEESRKRDKSLKEGSFVLNEDICLNGRKSLAVYLKYLRSQFVEVV